MAKFRPPGQCPVCGEWVYRGQVSCSECGACAKSGWKADATAADGLDLPDEDFDYDAFLEREFGGDKKLGGRIGEGRMSRVWWWAAVAVLAAMIWMLVLSVLRGG
jgi:hypothetical protein